MIKKRFPTVLSIAGSDCSGGAGIQADIKTISACRCYAATVITAVTAQNTCEVNGIEIISPKMIADQILACTTDFKIDAIKLGMLPTKEAVEQIADSIWGQRNIVLDPVMVSTSGHRLISNDAIEAIKKHLIPKADLITPNIPETEFLTGIKIESEEEFEPAAEAIKAMGAKSVLIKAGHLNKENLSDVLFHNDGTIHNYRYTKIITLNTHGTGCTLSSAIASYLAHGLPLPEAIKQAEDYIHNAILYGDEYGWRGRGPVHHFYKFW